MTPCLGVDGVEIAPDSLEIFVSSPPNNHRWELIKFSVCQIIILANHRQQPEQRSSRAYTILIGSSVSLSDSKSMEEKDSKQQTAKYKLDLQDFLSRTF